MADPPVFIPSTPAYERRVRWGLLLTSLALLLPFAGPTFVALHPPGWGFVRTPSVACLTWGCPSTPEWLLTLAAIPVVGSVTVLWWLGRIDHRVVVSTELVGLLTLVAWPFLVPIHLLAWMLATVGGFLVVSGTDGFVETETHERATHFSGLASAGGVLMWLGILAPSLLGYWSFWPPLLWSAPLVVFLFLAAPPLGWVRAHLQVFVGAVVLSLRPWILVQPASVGLTDVSPRPDSLRAPLSPGDLAWFADEAIFVLLAGGALTVAVVGLLDLACQVDPSLAGRFSRSSPDSPRD